MAEEREGKRRKRTAVALSYEPLEGAPKIVASGEGHIAEKIIETAKESDVPLYQDSKLAKTLLKLDIGDYIPEELYGVVAEILVFVDDMDRIKGKVLRGR
ncbi:MAG: EscU/YscU/HrcU family type III secretion system export apparatus switch protein [Lachnospiraceae bacterium]|nr:EscU/YscU/HrcU family type III secretion system export apparatus switch protein [Lachnospiraceae bacterium]